MAPGVRPQVPVVVRAARLDEAQQRAPWPTSPRASRRRTSGGGSRGRRGLRPSARAGAARAGAPRRSGRSTRGRPRRGSRGSPRPGPCPSAARSRAGRGRGSGERRPRRRRVTRRDQRAREGRTAEGVVALHDALGQVRVHRKPDLAQPGDGGREAQAPCRRAGPRSPPRRCRRPGPRRSPRTCSSPSGRSRSRSRVTALISTAGTRYSPSGSGSAPGAVSSRYAARLS